jgi:hypothetical protein
MIFERDPEDIGPESDEDVSFRMDLNQSIHDYDPDPKTGKCRGYYIRNGAQGVRCNSTQEYSVFHIDNRTYCCYLSEAGIDCGHGEGW